MKTYEAMFLFDSAAAHEWANVEAEVKRIMDRAEASLLSCERWDERKLAYEIAGRKRGCYVLTYFQGPGSAVPSIRRDCQLSDAILRVLVLRNDHVDLEEIRARAEAIRKPRTPPVPGPEAAEAPAQPAPSESAPARPPGAEAAQPAETRPGETATGKPAQETVPEPAAGTEAQAVEAQVAERPAETEG